ncbi:hypothetical protein F5880DRAFT_1629883 [Lentinula raphanica]|nr:hypothetical protein F5880DRAFT_1629883 [Lentinula raphanica]
MTAHVSLDKGYDGLLNAIRADNQTNPADILDDLEETYDNADLDLSEPNSSSIDLSELNKSVREISKGVSEKTAQEYHRLMKQCESFLVEHQMIDKDSSFFCTPVAVESTRSTPISLEHSFAKYTDTLSKGQILALGAIIF